MKLVAIVLLGAASLALAGRVTGANSVPRSDPEIELGSETAPTKEGTNFTGILAIDDDDNPEGEICNIIVGAVQEAKSVDSLGAAMLEACDHKRCPGKREHCKRTVDKIIGEMKGESAEEFCKHFRPPTLTAVGLLQQQVGQILSCRPEKKAKVCEIVVAAIKSQNKIDALEAPGMALCEKKREKCKEKCKKNVVRIIDDMHKLPADQVCKHMKPHLMDEVFAPDFWGPMPPPVPPMQVCDLCKKAIQKVKDSDFVNDSLKSNAHRLCGLFLEQKKVEECRKTVDKYYKFWSTKNAEEICLKMKMCSTH